VEFKPQLKGKDGDGKDDSAAAETEGKAEEPATDERINEDAELKEAASF
jgi:hypothetical protein